MVRGLRHRADFHAQTSFILGAVYDGKRARPRESHRCKALRRAHRQAMAGKINLQVVLRDGLRPVHHGVGDEGKRRAGCGLRKRLGKRRVFDARRLVAGDGLVGPRKRRRPIGSRDDLAAPTVIGGAGNRREPGRKLVERSGRGRSKTREDVIGEILRANIHGIGAGIGEVCAKCQGRSAQKERLLGRALKRAGPVERPLLGSRRVSRAAQAIGVGIPLRARDARNDGDVAQARMPAGRDDHAARTQGRPVRNRGNRLSARGIASCAEGTRRSHGHRGSRDGFG